MSDEIKAYVLFVPPDRNDKKHPAWRVVLTEEQLKDEFDKAPEHRGLNHMLVESGIAPIGIDVPGGKFMRLVNRT